MYQNALSILKKIQDTILSLDRFFPFKTYTMSWRIMFYERKWERYPTNSSSELVDTLLFRVLYKHPRSKLKSHNIRIKNSVYRCMNRVSIHTKMNRTSITRIHDPGTIEITSNLVREIHLLYACILRVKSTSSEQSIAVENVTLCYVKY